MLMGALATFTLVALMGVMMVLSMARGLPPDPYYPRLHALAALIGSGLVIADAVGGDERLYLNIGLAVVIIALGLVMALASKKGKKIPKAVLIAHAGLAVACYGILAFFTFNPQATLI
ncbi:hypothetical protein [Methylomagnum ishizawai]|uniref:hypothetical protein n=1 Tax=Methylomagnum ishizawai TaxID=1760988 RepID=UPI001C32573C|nr:hypothetical protein [Methylomagnum ishizawai]BBL77097.1 hypothetical protein MishRS11D_41950 [Methylomagnum ishizawai]